MTFLWILGVTFRFASYYGDHMVLQKKPAGAVVWGYGESGANVTLSLSKDSKVIMKKMAQVEGNKINLRFLLPCTSPWPHSFQGLSAPTPCLWWGPGNIPQTIAPIHFPSQVDVLQTSSQAVGERGTEPCVLYDLLALCCCHLTFREDRELC